MKVLILHQHFKVPQRGGAIRSYYLARALVQKGVHTVVITAHNESKYRKEHLDGIEIHYLPIPYDNRFGFYKRVFSFYRFIVQSVNLVQRVGGGDLCYAISTPLTTGIAAIRISKKYNIPYIFEVGDLWPDAPISMGFIRNPLSKALLYRLEKAIYRNAISIVALSTSIQDAVREKTQGKSVHILTNMSDTEFFRPEEKNSALEEKFQVKGKLVVSYIGAVGVANGLHFLLQCALACQREKMPVQFLICGDGSMVDEHKRFVRKIGLQNVSFIPFQDREGVSKVMNVTDVNFISYKPVKILETGSPNKYFDGLAAGKLTAINFGGWIKNEIEQEHCGIYVDPARPQDFAKAIKPFVDDAGLLSQYQRAGRKLAERKYSRNLLSESFWDIVKSACPVA